MTAPPATPAVETASSVIARIEKELRDLWAPPASGSMPPRSRVCTMNLLVVASSREILDRYTPIVDDVTRSIPARAVLASMNPDGPESFAGDATAIGIDDNGARVFSERVRLYAEGSASVRLPSAISTLTVPEIPTTLVWLGRVHTDDVVFLELAELSDRIVTDSDYTSLSSLLQLAGWAKSTNLNIEIGDLAWTRIAPWQELCARFFDDATLVDFSGDIRSLTVSQVEGRGGRIGSEAALLLGWFATRLGWKTSRLGGALRFLDPRGKTISVHFTQVAAGPAQQPFSLAGVELTAERQGVTLKSSLVRDLGSGSGLQGATADADMVLWRRIVGDAAPVEQNVRLGSNKGAKWLERTLRRPPKDPALLESILFAEQILEDGMSVS